MKERYILKLTDGRYYAELPAHKGEIIKWPCYTKDIRLAKEYISLKETKIIKKWLETQGGEKVVTIEKIKG